MPGHATAMQGRSHPISAAEREASTAFIELFAVFGLTSMASNEI
jgi:hypothetical protein